MDVSEDQLIEEDDWLSLLVERLERLDVASRRRVFAACVGTLEAVFEDNEDPKTVALATVVAAILEAYSSGDGPDSSGQRDALEGAWIRHSTIPPRLGLPAGYWKARDRIAQVLLRHCRRPDSEFSDEQCAVEVAQCFEAIAFVFAPPRSFPEAMQMETPRTDADGAVQFSLRKFSIIFSDMAGAREFEEMRACMKHGAEALQSVLPKQE